MGMIRNLVFDFGGVFCKISLQNCIDAFLRLGFKDVGCYMDLYEQRGIFGDLEAGRVSDEEFRRFVGEHTGREVSWADCQQAWLSFLVGVPKENLEALGRLRDAGYRLALLSNTNPFVARWFRSGQLDGRGHGIGFYITPEHQYLSFEQKAMKPGREIFEKMLRGEGFMPSETLFVDDGAVNLKTASGFGIHTFQPTNGELWGERLAAVLRQANGKV